MIQPIRPRPIVRPSQIQRIVFSSTLKTEANIPARIIPKVNPAVIPIRQPGCLRLRPRNRFIMRKNIPSCLKCSYLRMIARSIRYVKSKGFYATMPEKILATSLQVPYNEQSVFSIVKKFYQDQTPDYFGGSL